MYGLLQGPVVMGHSHRFVLMSPKRPSSTVGGRDLVSRC